MRVVFAGSPPFAVPVLEKLIRSPFKPVAAITQPDRPKGRGRETEPSDIAKMAKDAGVACLQPQDASDPGFLEQLRALKPDLVLVVSYGQILKESFLSIPAKGCFNLHASLLPRHRGASPIAAAILAGDGETGVSVQRMVKKLDAGDVVATKKLAIEPRDTTGDLLAELGRLGAELVLETLPQIESGAAAFAPQDESRATYAPKLKKESGQVDWKKTAEEVDRHVRAMMPWPVAFTRLATAKGEIRVGVLAGIPQIEGNGEPGKILSASPAGIGVACGKGVYQIKALQPEGGKPMAVGQFLNGNPVKIS